MRVLILYLCSCKQIIISANVESYLSNAKNHVYMHYIQYRTKFSYKKTRPRAGWVLQASRTVFTGRSGSGMYKKTRPRARRVLQASRAVFTERFGSGMQTYIAVISVTAVWTVQQRSDPGQLANYIYPLLHIESKVFAI